MKTSLLTVLICVFFQALSCECPWIREDSVRIEKHFAASELVFTANAKFNQPDSAIVKVNVLEVFRGNLEIGQQLVSSVIVRNNCDQTIYTEGKWLIYGHFEGDTVRLYMCSPSVSFDRPRLPPPPPPPCPDFDKNEENIYKEDSIFVFSDEYFTEAREKGKTRLLDEVNYLRILKTETPEKQ